MGLLDRLSSRRSETHEPAEATAARAEELAFGTKALRKFLSALSSKDSPVILDLSPVIGSNLTFFGEHLGCRVVVDDLFLEVDRHVQEQRVDELPAWFASRFPHADASFDGILCWDLMDYLDRTAAQALAVQLTRLLKPEGALLALFGTVPPTDARYTRYVIVDEGTLKMRPYPASRERQSALGNRQILNLFEHLRVSDSFLLQNHLREILFRKPASETP